MLTGQVRFKKNKSGKICTECVYVDKEVNISTSCPFEVTNQSKKLVSEKILSTLQALAIHHIQFIFLKE